MPGSRSSNARVRLVLPPPDGAAITKRLPTGTLMPTSSLDPSFYVLYLLAHLFDQYLDLERRLRQFRVDGLGAERIGFAVEFLHQKVEALAAASTVSQHAPHFGDVSSKARDFLGDVDLGRE